LAKTRPRNVSGARLLVVGAIVGSVAFGLYIGYLAYVNDSFPSQDKPFEDYAHVVSDSFNGTEFAFSISWDNASSLPLYAQLTSPSTDSANTPVCLTGLSSVTSGQVVFMPFTISPATATLENVDLSIAVQSVATGSEFTIIYNVPVISATNDPITPSNLTCQESPGSF
jgi:hypothetical protein